ncbi:WxL domain-containing protein [Periweissella fabaria]|uniref:WxL domain-containing protein n=1 Tax=Periweissella fabaria TaxID=546157 RepID=UPI00338EA0D2
MGPEWLVKNSDKYSIDLVANGDSKNILTPGTKQGMGITTLRFDDSNVQLTIPAAQQLVGTYSGSITWTLTPGTIPNTLTKTNKPVK